MSRKHGIKNITVVIPSTTHGWIENITMLLYPSFFLSLAWKKKVFHFRMVGPSSGARDSHISQPPLVVAHEFGIGDVAVLVVVVVVQLLGHVFGGVHYVAVRGGVLLLVLPCRQTDRHEMASSSAFSSRAMI